MVFIRQGAKNRLKTAENAEKKQIFSKNILKSFAGLKNCCNFANANEKQRGRLAQLVQSICLTSRGSAVRIRQRPPQENRLEIIDYQSVIFFVLGACHWHRYGGGDHISGLLARILQGFCKISRPEAIQKPIFII